MTSQRQGRRHAHLQDVWGEGGLQQLPAAHGLHYGLLGDWRQQAVGVQAQAAVGGAPLWLADRHRTAHVEAHGGQLLVSGPVRGAAGVVADLRLPNQSRVLQGRPRRLLDALQVVSESYGQGCFSAK